MRTTILTFLSSLLIMSTLAQQPGQDYTYSQACARKNPAANAAIAAFCHKTDARGHYSDTIMCPGPRSARGVVKQGVRAKITGNCTPQQWIPGQYCLLQFHYICATGGKRGMGQRRYGNGGCQTWTLEWANPGVGALAGAFGFGKRAEEGEEGGEVAGVEE